MLAIIFVSLSLISIFLSPILMAYAETEKQLVASFFLPLVLAMVFITLALIVA